MSNDNDTSAPDLYELAARLALQETVMSDLLLNAFAGRSSDEFRAYRTAAVNKLRFKTQIAPDRAPPDEDARVEVSARAVAFAERFFSQVESDLAKAKR